MAYILNKSDGSVLLTLQDGDLDTSTSLGLLGRNYTGYGEVQNENFIFLLENFANVNPPTRPITGQCWFDSANNVLKVYEGEQWIPVGSATLSVTPPPEVIGSFWLKATTNQIFVFTNTGWELVGPQGVEGFNKTRAESIILKDINDNNRPVIVFYVNGVVEAICSSAAFTINTTNSISGFLNIAKGITISTNSTIVGNLFGNSASATRLQTLRTINNVPFDGTENIIVKANTNNVLVSGDYLLGNNFDGSVERTWSVDATSENLIGKVVARDNSGSFSAQEITAVALIGTLQGNVNAPSGTSFFNRIISPLIEGQTYTGNAASATRLRNIRKINSVNFDGTSDITITSNAETLTGTFINPSVLTSNLRSVGNLINLIVEDQGIQVGQGNKVTISAVSANPRIKGDSSLEILINQNDGIKIVGVAEAVQQGGPQAPAILSLTPNLNIGTPNKKFNLVHANRFLGNANSASRLETVRNINGTPFDGSQNIVIPAANVNKTLTRGNYLLGDNFNGSTDTVWAVDASSENQFGKIVARDSSGNFSANIITGNLNGNANSSSRFQQSRLINGVPFDGTSNISINTNNNLIAGNYLVGATFNGSAPRTWSVDATPSNVFNKVVARDSQGSFFATSVTANTFNGFFNGTSITQPFTDSSTKIATTAFVKNVVDELRAQPFWAGATTFSNVVATYVNFPIGTSVAFWEERNYLRPANSNGGSVLISDRYRRVIKKISSTTWQDV